MKPVFVYGTLRPGQQNYHLVEDYVKEAVPAQAPNLQLCDLGHFPMAFMDPGTVYGEVLWFSSWAYEAVLERLDKLEGHPLVYKRVIWNVLQKPPAREPLWVSVWVYVGTEPDRHADKPRISGGDWVRYLAHRSS